MDNKKRKCGVYTHSASNEKSITVNATKRRVHVEHHPAPPRSPPGQAVDNFDYLMGFPGDVEIAAPLPEGPAALKIKVKAKRYESSASISLGRAS
jgi:hypothetical protein